jgi:hypothetical protein
MLADGPHGVADSNDAAAALGGVGAVPDLLVSLALAFSTT